MLISHLAQNRHLWFGQIWEASFYKDYCDSFIWSKKIVKLVEVDSLIQAYDVVAIDEGQFFEDVSLCFKLNEYFFLEYD